MAVRSQIIEIFFHKFTFYLNASMIFLITHSELSNHSFSLSETFFLTLAFISSDSLEISDSRIEISDFAGRIFSIEETATKASQTLTNLVLSISCTKASFFSESM